MLNNAFVIALLSFFFFYLCYRYYATHLSKKIFELDPTARTPAHELNDGFEYVPTPKLVVFGHHFTSIAGAAPVVGPAIAIIWGWVPAVLWVVIGCPLIGAVHDFGTVVASLRNKGKNIGDLVEIIVGKKAKIPFLFVAWFCLWLVLAVFALVIANLFTMYPAVVFPVWSQIIIAVAFGYALRKFKVPLLPLSIIGVILVYASIYVGLQMPIEAPAVLGSPIVFWCIMLTIYCLVVTRIPVWILLQSRDYLNALMLITAMGVGIIGLTILRPEFVAPAFHSVPDAPPVIPLLFITIACGASAGLHGLIGTGTTSKQIDKEPDAQLVAYGGMLGEGVLALMAVLACGAGFATRAAWDVHYASWAAADGLGAKVGGFVNGMGYFVSQVGIPQEFAMSMAAVVMICFAATTLDSCSRVQRMLTQTFFESVNVPVMTKQTPATFFAVLTAFALMMVDGGSGPGSGGMIMWPLFGNANQLMAAVGITFVTVFVATMKKPLLYTLIPAVLLLSACMWALITQIIGFAQTGQNLLLVIGSILGFLQVWVLYLCIQSLREIAADKGLNFSFFSKDEEESKSVSMDE